MKKLVLATALLVSVPAYAGLDGTEVTLQTLLKATPSDTPVITSFEQAATVGAHVEFPHVAELFNPAVGGAPTFYNLIDVGIDIADDNITIDFDNSAPFSRFGANFENTYVFRFDSEVARSIAAAQIDNSVTTLGLEASDITLVGDELRVNVEGLAFNPSSFARVNLLIEEGPISPAEGPLPAIPEPATYAMMLAGLLLVGGVGVKRRRQYDVLPTH